MVGMGIVNRVVFSFAHVCCKWLPMVLLLGVIRPTIMLDEVGQPRVWAGGVIRGIGEREDILILADREAFDLAEGGVLEFGGEFLEVMRAAGGVGREGLAEAFDGTGGSAG